MWGTIAHLEMQPELVFSLILAPTQQARINREGRFICGQDKKLNKLDLYSTGSEFNRHSVHSVYVHVILETNTSHLLVSNIIFGIKRKHIK